MRFLNLAAEKIRKSPFIIPIGIVFIVMLLNSIGLSWEDYSTSYLGYVAFPTIKANQWVCYLVALLPQLVQIGMTYVFMDDTNKRWAAGLAGASLFVDVFFDVWYKIGGASVPNYGVIPVALMESLFIYTLGSELMLTVSFGMVIKLWPDFSRELKAVLKPFIEGLHGGLGSIGTGFAWMMGSNEQTNNRNNNDNRRNDNNKVNIRPGTRSELNPRWQQKREPAYDPSYNMATAWDLGKDDDTGDEIESVVENHDELPIKKRGRGRPPKDRGNE